MISVKSLLKVPILDIRLSLLLFGQLQLIRLYVAVLTQNEIIFYRNSFSDILITYSDVIHSVKKMDIGMS